MPAPGADGSGDGGTELLRRRAFYEQFNQPVRRTGRRFPWGMGALLLAMLGGLVATCWNDLTRSDVLPSMRVAERDAVPSMTVDAEGKVRTRDGIARGELPYDGQSSDETLGASASRHDVRHVDTAKQATSTADLDSNIKTPHAAPVPVEKSIATASAATQDAASHEKSVSPAPDAKKKKASDKHQSPPHKQTRVASATKPHATGSHPTVAKSSSAHVPKLASRSRHDPEIARLKEQAEDELLKKKTGESPSPSDHRSQYRRGLIHDISRLVRARFDNCSNVGSLLERERCKWKVCGGMWGHNGCPSYRLGPAKY